MKHSLSIVFCVFLPFTGFAVSDPGANANNKPSPAGSKMTIKIGTHTFTATLQDNATAAAFKSLLPMTVKMVELNGNEKYFDLSGKLPTDPSNPQTIQSAFL